MMEVEQIGPHRLLCGDITELEVVDTLMAGAKADVIYSDPPWGPGNQQYWHTMNKRGSKPRTSWESFICSFASVCAQYRKPNAPVFVEMGLRWTDDLDEAMDSVGLRMTRRWVILYGPKKRPLENTVALFGAPCPPITLPDPPHGEPVTRAILEPVVREGDIILDPCVGLGMTARATFRFGGIFYGSELNDGRLRRTTDWLKKRIK